MWILVNCENAAISFQDYVFPSGDVYFSGATFGKGKVDFNHATFGKGTVNFNRATFGEGTVNFNRATFGEGTVNFNRATFGEGDVDFTAIRMGTGSFVFMPLPLTHTKILSFQYAKFEGALVIGGLRTNTALNLSNTQIAHPLELHDVQIDFRKRYYTQPTTAIDPTDSSSFRRLKKLAKDANDHERALEFFAQEMRADYGYGIRGWRLKLFLLYDALSNYGRSILRPAIALVVLTILYSGFYHALSTTGAGFRLSVEYAMGHALPFYAGARSAVSDNKAKQLFGDDMTMFPEWLTTLTLSQGVFSGAFLFLLIALALRNTFRS